MNQPHDVMRSADVVIGIGARFSMGNPAGEASTLVNINIDDSELTRVQANTIPLHGDARATIEALLPDRPVVCVVGDGGFMFNSSELSSAVKYGIGVVTVVFRNDSYGNVARDLNEFFGGTYETDLVNPDFVAFAESFGAVGMRAEDPMDLARLIPEALERKAPVIIDVPVGHIGLPRAKLLAHVPPFPGRCPRRDSSPPEQRRRHCAGQQTRRGLRIRVCAGLAQWLRHCPGRPLQLRRCPRMSASHLSARCQAALASCLASPARHMAAG